MKLLLLTPCDKVIQDPQFGHSLISIFHGIRFETGPNPDLPSNAVVPKEWAIFSKWEVLPEETGKSYESVVEVRWPDDSVFFNYKLPATHPTRNGMAFVNRMNVFPVGQVGNLRILQTLESDGERVFGPVELLISVELGEGELEEQDLQTAASI